jgi:hypothetical protein
MTPRKDSSKLLTNIGIQSKVTGSLQTLRSTRTAWKHAQRPSQESQNRHISAKAQSTFIQEVNNLNRGGLFIDERN